MTTRDTVLRLMLRKFETRAPIDESDRNALLALPYRLHSAEPGAYLVREGERPERSCLIISGLAFRHKVTLEGARQIVGVHIPGDFVDRRIAAHRFRP